MRTGIRTSIAAAVAATLVVGLAGAATAAPAPGVVTELLGSALVRFPEFAPLPDSAGLGAPSMVRGVLRDPAGEPLRGAQVLLAAWPRNEELAKLPIGGEFELIPLARTVTDRSGRYDLRMGLTPALVALAGANGIDIELNVFHGGRHYVYLSQVHPDLKAATWAGSALTHALVPAVRERADGALDLVLDPATGEDLNAAAPVALAAGEPPIDERPITRGDLPQLGMSCTNWKLLGTQKVMTTAASALIRNGATVVTRYDEGSSTASTTGLSIDGGISFGINGSRERSITTGAEFHPVTAARGSALSREFQVQIVQEVKRRVCHGNHFQRYKVQYLTQPSEITGGGDVIASRLPQWTCHEDNIADAGGLKAVFTTDARAATYSSAFTFTPLGRASFTGAAVSGYSKTVRIEFRFQKGRRGGWCGDSALPTKPDQRLQGFQL
ncbi:MAG: hypothetical protein ACT4PP_14405 [Sporichthyaceae bacterium]